MYGKVLLINKKNEEVIVVGDEWEIAEKKIYTNMSIPHQGVFHNKKIFKVNGKFDKEFKICGDYELILRNIKKEKPYFFFLFFLFFCMSFARIFLLAHTKKNQK